MQASRLLLLLLLILVAVVLVVVVLRRGSAQRDAHRAEAAGLRSEAETLATTLPGQTAFADQAAERAELARVEAEEKAREAARLEAEAEEHRAAVEATQREYEATMRRADDIDPDVKESSFPAVAEGERADAVANERGEGERAEGERAEGERAEGERTEGRGDSAGDGHDSGMPMTRAERREAREAGEEGHPAPSAGSSAAAAGAAGAAAAGDSAWAARGDDEQSRDAGHDDEHSSERIASATDFRDDVPAEQGEVYPSQDGGSDHGMSDSSSTDTQPSSRDDDGLEAGGAAAAASAGAGGAYAATRAMHEDGGDGSGADGTADSSEHRTDETDATDADGSHDADVSHDVESSSGEWGGPPRTESAEPAEMTIVEPENYARTEPVLASEQAAVAPRSSDSDADAGAHSHGDTDGGAPEAAGSVAGVRQESDSPDPSDSADTSDQHAPAEAGAAVAETDDADRSPADVAEQSDEQRYDPTPTRDWAADEGELLEQTHDRGDRLEAERGELAQESDDATEATASTDSDAPASGGRRISAFEEIRDGGFGVGSAAPLDDGAQPLDHPVQGYHDMTFRAPGDAGYDSADPDVWFYDERAAERSGFRRADG